MSLAFARLSLAVNFVFPFGSMEPLDVVVVGSVLDFDAVAVAVASVLMLVAAADAVA